MTPAEEHRIADAIHDTLAQMPDLERDLDALVIAVAYSISAQPKDVRRVWADRFQIWGAC